VIVVVDDDITFLEMVQMLLEAEGYQVVTHWRGERADEIIRVTQPDLVIVDWWMTDMLGSELVETLKAHPDTAEIPIVVCSAAHIDLQSAMGQLEQYGVSILLKPFDIDTLLRVVRERTE
jgi:two-component system phosphate regulon response regulator PhoB